MDDAAAVLAKARELGNIEPTVLLADIEARLIRDYRAEPIAVESISAEDYANDEHVDESVIVSLLTITDSGVLASISSEEEKEHFFEDEEWDGPVFDDIYSVMNEEHGSLKRVSVLLERDPANAANIGNFRVYGGGQKLREWLWATTGILPRDHGPVDGELFRRYIELTSVGRA